jgi:hypothetical protein
MSHAPAERLDRAQNKEAAARHNVVKAAQRTAHVTATALAVAPASRPVEVATDANASTVALLDQAAGPMEAKELARLREQVAGLLSDNADLRARAESQRAADVRNIGDVSAALARAESASVAAAAKLRVAYDRENALANELRAQRAWLWIAAAIAALLALAWLYTRIMLGGIPSAVGAGLARLRATNPRAASEVTDIFDSLLNRHEQDRIAKSAR